MGDGSHCRLHITRDSVPSWGHNHSILLGRSSSLSHACETLNARTVPSMPKFKFGQLKSRDMPWVVSLAPDTANSDTEG